MPKKLAYGIYDALLDNHLQEILDQYPELPPVFGKLDAEEQPARYADFVAKVVRQVLREETDPDKRRQICNTILAQIYAGTEHQAELRQLVSGKRSVLQEITPPGYASKGIPRPHTPICESSLFTGPPQNLLQREIPRKVSMPGSIFIIQNDHTLIEMTHQPYAQEDHLQRFLERYPALPAGDQVDIAAMKSLLNSGHR